MNIRTFDRAEFRYRLGDLVLLGNDALKMVLDPDSPFHDTIGYEYATLTLDRNRFLDFKLLKKLIKAHTEKHQYPLPPPDVLVIHFRAGDRRRVDGSEIDLLLSCAKSACAKSRLAKIQIVTAFHYENRIEADLVDELGKENLRNLQDFVSGLEACGMSVSVKSSGRIDEDFCYISNARHFLPTKGGYSVLAGICNPNRVHPTFPGTTREIRFYAKKRPVSLKMADLLLLLKKSFKNKKDNPVFRLLKTVRPVLRE